MSDIVICLVIVVVMLFIIELMLSHTHTLILPHRLQRKTVKKDDYVGDNDNES